MDVGEINLEGMVRIHLAQDTVHWHHSVKEIKNNPFLKKRIFLQIGRLWAS
jgi:hypothetical protein